MIKVIEILKRDLVFSVAEKKYIKNFNNNSFLNNPKILVQANNEYIFLAKISLLNKNYRINFDTFYFETLFFKISDFFTLKFILKKIFHYLKKRRYLKLFKVAGANKNQNMHLSTKKIIKTIKDTYTIYKSINSKEDVTKISYNELFIGDLIYDSYLRFYNTPTINTKGFQLFFVILKAVFYVLFFESIVINYEKLYIYYSTYINSGIPIRVFLKHNKEVITFCGEDKKLSINDFHFTKFTKNYKSEFESKNNKNEKVELGLNHLRKRLSGKNNLFYMINSPYLKNDISLNRKLDGVVFLHDFMDSPHVEDNIIFPDFYEWTLFILNLILDEQLNIGVKPHPNQVPESKKVVENLKKAYPEIYWIDENISNNEIFDSGIKFGLTVYGSIISELAYKSIVPICCSENPTSSYDFSLLAKNIIELKKYIINYKNYQIINCDTSYQIGSFIYMHYLNENEAIFNYNFDFNKNYHSFSDNILNEKILY